MKLKVICKKCDRIFSWDADHDIETCPYCNSELTIKDVRMNALEHAKLMSYRKAAKTRAVTAPAVAKPATPAPRPEAVATLKKPEEEQTGKFVIKKGRTKYGTFEVTNPDYMILKLSFWAMGPQQKLLVSHLSDSIKRFMKDAGLELERR